MSRVTPRLSRTLSPRALAPLALALLAALALGACGEAHTRVTTGTYAGASGKNAPYLNVGPLIYEVQISRELNPYNVEDAAYLAGLPPAERELRPGEEWFGVFMQVYNNSSLPHPVATDITISDTEGNVYRPVVPAATNSFAYRPEVLPAKSQVPGPNTIAASGPTQGALLLYKIKVISLDNRPLTVKIVDPAQPTQTASAELDV
ncbi:MAG TPA: hypothetical protein VK756_07390 [Solirubrobacteraceae bacterium]|jgi:hypothetical protein|nr:hypothetical protein [Solirubrobacteraceae bacterium]